MASSCVTSSTDLSVPTELSRKLLRARLWCRQRFRRAGAGRLSRSSLPGVLGLLCYATARLEVSRAIRKGAIQVAEAMIHDSVDRLSVPSYAGGNLRDRVLAEIDMDVYAFAVNPVDSSFFNRRDHRLLRTRNRLDVVLRNGRVCLRKKFLRPGIRAGLRRWLWGMMGQRFYNEVAALLRLRDLAGVPRILELERINRTVYMDFIKGEDLRKRLEGR